MGKERPFGWIMSIHWLIISTCLRSVFVFSLVPKTNSKKKKRIHYFYLNKAARLALGQKEQQDELHFIDEGMAMQSMCTP